MSLYQFLRSGDIVYLTILTYDERSFSEIRQLLVDKKM